MPLGMRLWHRGDFGHRSVSFRHGRDGRITRHVYRRFRRVRNPPIIESEIELKHEDPS